MIPPLRCRKIQSEMKLKALSLQYVAEKTGLSLNRVCKLLRGREVYPKTLARVEAVVANAPMPKEAKV